MINYDDYIELLKQKDEEAFALIYNDTKAAVFSIIYGILKDKQLSEDVMQDTYIKMIASINSYKVGRNFKNWLLTIARNQAIDLYRKRKKEVLIEEEDQDYIIDQNSVSSVDQLQAEELLSVLDTNEREIVLLRIVDDVKFKDIAKVVNKPIGTVLWIYSKAIKKMKKYEGGILDEKK